MEAILALEDGRIFRGRMFGAEKEVTAEVVFNTSMAGYQEVLTDPSYCGQMVVMTYPLIGNYGINPEDYESDRPYLSAFIIKELSGIPSNWRSTETLDAFLKRHGVVGLQGLDTRALTRHIREKGAQRAVISSNGSNPAALVEKAKEAPQMVGRDLVKEVTCEQPYIWEEGDWDLRKGYTRFERRAGAKPYFVVALDLGIKYNILRQLTQSGCRVTVVPATTTAEEILKFKPDGVFLSNGPGDPAAVTYAIDTVRSLIGKVPIFGICLGHQILNLALGGSTYKLRFGHHGGNQPIMDSETKKVEITSQNHGFAVDAATAQPDVEIISLNLNDRTVEGIRHKSLPVFSVQYHPEAAPGPQDSSHLFERFVNMMKQAS
ncbi:Carbamoyl-phosphate synthase, small subunit [Nitrospina gracilis 3/211]|uniref:Carbamoyl phosphate synthase small chain n=1 Tax=Nitrospina gracilis (strain 3/211) TaxID=1266370 RepID=M1ZDL2_NITG3|nr:MULTISPECIES: glutamine-hydrolyzing carbamoyl-phosphate synthase small subunit [Nitrospina]MCF8724414.1 carbamoyl-phosphate synthase small subunit [Nitrospina sp. Nb-3]CCQ91570.1 Carbamoyl-phosphate synthase, small subunit [Nitrospina gracilis 3/211]